MVYASVSPWLVDPAGKVLSSWNIPLDIGWQFHTGILNYGVLCLGCAICAWLLAWAQRHPRGTVSYFQDKHRLVGLICLAPVALFILQYLFNDVVGINLLTQHKIQLLLVQQHFGYSIAAQRIPIDPFQLDASTLWGRLELFIDQASPAFLLPCLATAMLIYSRRFVDRSSFPERREKRRRWLIVGLLSAFLLILSRAPAAMACQYEAKVSLATGSYSSALSWLNAAGVLNPSLNQVAFYHEERGQALYFLHLDPQSADSRAYIAATIRRRGDYLDAYQQLLAVWQAQPKTPWVIDEMSATLERLAEFISPLDGPPIHRSYNDDRSLSWLQLLTEVDANNVYGRYMVGRIQYDLHDYAIALAQMSAVTQISTDADVQSSAYTYMALSAAGEGDYIGERTLLLKATELDPNYHNNTAREDLSGLR